MKTSTILKSFSSLFLFALLAIGKTSAQSTIFATSNFGTQVSNFVVNNGAYVSGSTFMFTPTFPGQTTNGTTTAALGRSDKPSQANGFFYWLPNSGGLNLLPDVDGTVEVFGSDNAGGGQARIGSLDMNGISTTELGFVRLGMNPQGKGFVLASDGAVLYLAEFSPVGTSAQPVTTTSAVVLIGGSPATFQNGDICFSGNGTMYALANNGAGVTQIYTGQIGSPTTLTKKWDLVGPGNTPFTGTVNGVAFDQLGNLYVSVGGGVSGNGLYFIDQNTVNTQAAGTVVCTLVRSENGLQDLASFYFPSQTLFPVDLISFTGNLKNDVTTLNWETENETNFDHFDIERRDGSAGSYSVIGTKVSQGGNGHYNFSDNLTSNSGKAFNYRLKAVDIDGKFKYSNVILIRKDQKSVTGITMNPNPVVGGMATVRFSALLNGNAVFNILDLTGKVVLTQQTRVYEGTNSITINNLDRLQPGSYLLQMLDGDNTLVTKFSVSR